jgi:hypothetical protein
MTDQQTRNWQSIRTILEGLILIGVCWLTSSVNDQAKATIQVQAQMTAMNDELRTLRGQLADIPTLSRSLARIEVKLEEHERRISEVEGRRR